MSDDHETAARARRLVATPLVPLPRVVAPTPRSPLPARGVLLVAPSLQDRQVLRDELVEAGWDDVVVCADAREAAHRWHPARFAAVVLHAGCVAVGELVATLEAVPAEVPCAVVGVGEVAWSAATDAVLPADQLGARLLDVVRRVRAA